MYWFKYESYDYMDEYPSVGYRMFNDLSIAKEWEEYMNLNYSGGSTKVIGYATQEEVFAYIKDLELDPMTIQNIQNINNYYKK